MASIGYDPQFLQRTAQAQLRAALRLHSAAWKSPETNPNNMPSSSHSPEPPFPADDPSLHGYTRIPLSMSSLNRTFSTPIPANSSVSARMPEESSGVSSPLHRTVSSPVPAAASSSVRVPEEFKSAPAHSIHLPPIPESELPVPAFTPPRPPVAGKVASTSGYRCGLSPVAKRAKRMQEKIIEMKELWDEVLKEEEEDAASLDAHPCPHKEDCEATSNVSRNVSGTEELCNEPVWLERKGDIRILHFKCHCNKRYQMLLSGSDCYYKLNCF